MSLYSRMWQILCILRVMWEVARYSLPTACKSRHMVELEQVGAEEQRWRRMEEGRAEGAMTLLRETTDRL